MKHKSNVSKKIQRLVAGPDCPGEDGHEHRLRLSNEGLQVRLQDRDQVMLGALIQTHVNTLGQHDGQGRTEPEKVSHR